MLHLVTELILLILRNSERNECYAMRKINKMKKRMNDKTNITKTIKHQID